MLIGYARVSTEEQLTDVQRNALVAAGVERIFEEKRSGKDDRRPVLAEMLAQLRPGDQVVVYKLDRLSRSLADLLMLMRRIESAGASFRSLTESIDTATPAGIAMMQMIGVFAQFERSMIVERTKAGMQAARGRGQHVGRPRAMLPLEEVEAVRLAATGEHSKTAIARRYGVNISTIKRVLRRVPA